MGANVPVEDSLEALDRVLELHEFTRKRRESLCDGELENRVSK